MLTSVLVADFHMTLVCCMTLHCCYTMVGAINCSAPEITEGLLLLRSLSTLAGDTAAIGINFVEDFHVELALPPKDSK